MDWHYIGCQRSDRTEDIEGITDQVVARGGRLRDFGEFAKRMEFSSVAEAVLMLCAGKSPALRSQRRHLSCEGPIPFADIDERQHGVGAVGVLGQAAIAGLGEAPQAT